MKKITEQIIKFIKKHADTKPVVIGLSGGIDSAVVAYLAVAALGKEKVHTLYLPSKSNSKDDLKHSELIANLLETQHTVASIEEIVDQYSNQFQFINDKKTIGNLKARIRMSIIYAKANFINGLVLGTGNKSEILTGYFTKFGDSACDILPIGDLLKTDVKKLAAYLKIPEIIINKAPSAGLWLGQTDEEELGLTYENLDAILFAIENKKNLSIFNKAEVELVMKYKKRTNHKRCVPKICKI